MKFMKKIMAMALSLVMVMSMCVSAFAATYENKTLSIKDPVEGHTYKVYQLLKGSVSALNGGSGTLADVVLGQNAKKDAVASDIVNALVGKSGGELGDAAYGYIDTTSDPVATFKKGETTSASVPEGYYVIVDAEGPTSGTDITYSRYVVAVNGDTEISPKTTTPSIDKTITSTGKNAPLDSAKKNNTAAIGDSIGFQIKGSVPNYEGYKYYYYVINDTFSEGLTFNGADSVKVTVGGKELTLGTDYYVYQDGQSIQIAFEDLMQKDDDGNYKYAVGSDIIVTYSATVNDKAVIGEGTGNTNTAYLTYSNKPGDSDRHDTPDPENPENPSPKPGTPDSNVPKGETPKVVTHTYVTELNLFKVDENGEPLAGAEFTITGENLTKVILTTSYEFTEHTGTTTGSYYKLADGTYTTKAPTENVYEEVQKEDGTTEKQLKTKSNYELYADAASEDGGDTVTVSKTYDRTVKTEATSETVPSTGIVVKMNEQGYATVVGLNAGTYKIVESKTPTGYNTMTDKTITITGKYDTEYEEGAQSAKFYWSAGTTNISVVDGKFNMTIENVKGKVLPSTGGIGTTIFYIIGSIMVLGAGILLITKKRMGAN